MSNKMNKVQKFNEVVNLVQELNGKVLQEGTLVYLEYGVGEEVNVLKYDSVTGVWREYDNLKGDFVRVARVDVLNALEEYRLARVSAKEPELQEEKELTPHEKLLAYLKQSGADPSVSVSQDGEREYKTWLVNNRTVMNRVGTERWGSNLPGEKMKEKPALVVLMELQPGVSNEFVASDIEDAWKALGTVAETKQEKPVKEEPVKEQRVVADKDMLTAYLDSQTTSEQLRGYITTVWYMPNGQVVMYDLSKNMWKFTDSKALPPMKVSVQYIWDYFHLMVKAQTEQVKLLEGSNLLMGKSIKQLAIVEALADGIKVATPDKPFVPTVRLPYDSLLRKQGIAFKGNRFFRADGNWPEYSVFVEHVMNGPYIKLVSDDYAYLGKVITYGYPFKDQVGREQMDTYPFNASENKRWKVVFGYIRDDGGTLYLVPESSKVNQLSDLGVYVSIDDPAKVTKAAKYLNRLCAPTWKASFSTFVSWDEKEQVATYRHETGKKFTVKYKGTKGLSEEDMGRVDGEQLVSERFCKIHDLSKHPQLGDAWSATFGAGQGEVKGHFVCKPGLEYDLVVYDYKGMVKSETVYFGCLGKLKPINPRTDLQSWDNFRFERPGMADKLAQAWRKKIWIALDDERMFRKMLLKYINTEEEDLWYGRDRVSGDYEEDTWVLKQALRTGPSILSTPALKRSAVRFLMFSIMDMERGRIPLDGVALSGYVIQDPYSFDSKGNLLPEDQLFIKEGQCVMPDIEPGTEVAFIRQPSENQNAHVFMTVVHDPRYDAFKGRGIVILGAGAHKVLARLGGADYDDRFIVFYDKFWVKMFHELSEHPYPETEKIKVADRVGEFSDIGVKKAEYYNHSHLFDQIRAQQGNRAGIGPVVNACMVDNRLSHPEDKAFNLEQVKAIIEENKRLGKVAHVAERMRQLEWYLSRPDYQMRLFATNQELVIDRTVLDRSVAQGLGDIGNAVKQFHSGVLDVKGKPFMGMEPTPGIGVTGTLIYPWFAYAPEMSRRRPEQGGIGRIPGHKYEKHDFLVIDTRLCKSIKALMERRKRFMEMLTWKEWTMVRPASEIAQMEVQQIPNFEYINECLGIGRMRQEGEAPGYVQVWRAAREKHLAGKDLTGRAFFEAYNVFKKEVSEWLSQFDDQTVKDMALVLYCRTYEQQYSEADKDEHGKRIPFRDARLWFGRMGTMLIKALHDIHIPDEETGRLRPLVGLYAKVDLEDKVRWELDEAKEVIVYIKGYNVYRESSNELIGTIPVNLREEGIGEGMFIMDEGIIELRKPHSSLLPMFNPEVGVIDPDTV